MELDNLLHPDADSNIETVIVLQVLLSSATPVSPATSLPLSAYVVYFSLGLLLPNIPLSANASTLIRHTRRHISNPPHIWHQHTSAPAHTGHARGRVRCKRAAHLRSGTRMFSTAHAYIQTNLTP